ncbi:uncharacterized protein ACA1_184000 [Acanthamoeba castellanii str. Neff]|uniref:Uncharacterized protein n=1 Tax=Acanthamoeba castellanii (strain ATCC 30010 / Neff) TaxID=1257118 RepID=L8H7D4_ACACF|nr:uncharacterized protein ACA1_184000 [Acanthamoeba castellanii str. Neff]ELR21454.1 hypothetical protein ACA1_184000 [Acanthamoeba castellanii str. Neff]
MASTGVRQLRQHVPLIKFPQRHGAAVQSLQDAALPSRHTGGVESTPLTAPPKTTTMQTSPNLPTPAKFDIKSRGPVTHHESMDELPARYRRALLSEEAIDLIQMGGAVDH